MRGCNAIRIAETIRGEAGIERANGILTFQLGPDHVVATLSLEFADHLTTPEIEAIVRSLEQRIRANHPEIIARLRQATDREHLQQEHTPTLWRGGQLVESG
jgi:divalent metal cation (Fe/Co/Zn/Cd) transporter